MANNISPGVYVVEKDISQYATGENTSIVGVVGFASKGPTNTPTLITSREQLVKVFGEPSEDIPSQALEAGMEIMEVGNRLYFIRAADEELVSDAETAAPFGGCPTVEVSSTGNYGVTRNLYLKVQVYDNDGVAKFSEPKQFNIPSGIAATQASAILSVIGGALDQDHLSVQTFGSRTFLVGAYAGQNASLAVSAYSNIATTTPILSALKPVFYDVDNEPVLTLPAMVISTNTYSTDALNTATITIPASNNTIVVSSTIGGNTNTRTVTLTAGTSSLFQIRSAINSDYATNVSAGIGWYYPTDTSVIPYIYTTPNPATTVNTYIWNTAVSGSFRGPTAIVSVSGGVASALGLTAAAGTAVSAAGTSSTEWFKNSSSVQAYGATLDSSCLAYKISSLYPGAGYNLTQKADGSYIGNSVQISKAAQDNSIISVADKGAVAESYKVGLNSAAFFESVINTGTVNPISEYIKASLVNGANFENDIDATSIAFTSELSAVGVAASTLNYDMGGFVGMVPPYRNYIGGVFSPDAALSGAGDAVATDTYGGVKFNKLIAGTYNLANGANGYDETDQDINDAAIIGAGGTGDTTKTGLYALDRDDLNISVAIVPGINTTATQNALINLAESTQNFLALISPPYASVRTANQAIDWSNGRSETRTTAINSSFAAIYWPWVKVFSVFDNTDRWYDPVIFAARQMCYNDLVAEPWFAPAGFTRGKLSKPKEVEVYLTEGDRDSMYAGGNVINPIVNFPQAGITIFGQRTAQRTASALDRINVRRLMIALRKIVINSTQALVFEPNDVFTWQAIKNLIDPVLNDIKNRRGLIDYSVVCDETTNTPARQERNEVWCKIVLRPTKAAESITFELNVTNQSAKIG
jgi:phage tail sheath protein FI